MRHAERAKVVSITIKRWNQWNNVRQLHLHRNMRARRACNSMEEADRFSTWLLRIGEGREPMYDNGVVNDLIRIPEETAVDSVDQLLESLFISVEQRIISKPNYFDTAKRRCRGNQPSGR